MAKTMNPSKTEAQTAKNGTIDTLCKLHACLSDDKATLALFRAALNRRAEWAKNRTAKTPIHALRDRFASLIRLVDECFASNWAGFNFDKDDAAMLGTRKGTSVEDYLADLCGVNPTARELLDTFVENGAKLRHPKLERIEKAA